MISTPPKMVIQHNMARIFFFFYHALVSFRLLITVTFSTLTPVINSYFRFARQNEAARAADAAACLDTSVGTVFLKNGWYWR
jgi:hypothetical protein